MIPAKSALTFSTLSVPWEFGQQTSSETDPKDWKNWMRG